MSFLLDVASDAVGFLAAFGPELRRVVALTIVVSGSATVIGLVVGIPLGTALGLGRWRGRGFVLALVNVGMAIPPVLAGLVILLLLWSSGPLGSLRLLFTPWAMIAAQSLLAIPIAAGLTAAALRGLPADAIEQLEALTLSPIRRGMVALREVWPGVLGAGAAAFGRVMAEVGAVLIVGGNIVGETRVLTTAIVEEARQARFGPALALGLVLMALALVVNVVVSWAQLRERR